MGDSSRRLKEIGIASKCASMTEISRKGLWQTELEVRQIEF